MGFHKILTRMVTTLFLLVCSNILHASVVTNFSLSGDITFASGSPYGYTDCFDPLCLGQTATLSGTFDGTIAGTGTQIISFGDGTSNTMTFSVGVGGSTVFYTEDMDLNFLTGFPKLEFVNGVLESVDSVFADGFNSSGIVFGNGAILSGLWDNTSYTSTVVPVPAAVWLFGSGLIGLVGVARRKSAS